MLELGGHLPFPVIGVQAANNSYSSQYPVNSIEELTKRYWQEIRAMQPQGPYSLGGFSFGYRVAHEIARLAHVEGHSLYPLALLNGAPFSLPPLSEDDKKSTDGNNSGEEVPKIDESVAATYVHKGEKLGTGDPMMVGIRRSNPVDAGILKQLANQYLTDCKLNTKYHPYSLKSSSRSTDQDNEEEEEQKPKKQSLWLRVHLYKANLWQIDDLDQFRDRLGIEIEVFDVPGSHLTLLQPAHVEFVARQIVEGYHSTS